MGIWSDIATWRGPTVNQGGRMSQQRGVVLHIAQGSFEGTISWQRNPDAEVSSHFIVDYDGDIAQMVDTDTVAWTQADGNGYWLSIENAGWVPDPLTSAQVEACARILAKAHDVYGVKLQLANSPSGYGLGYHAMGAPAWGHSECPGSAIVNQRQQIVDLASGGAMTCPSASEIARAVVNQMLGSSGPSVGVALQNTYRATGPDGPILAAIAELSAKIDALSADTCSRESTVELIREELAHQNRFNADRVRALIREEIRRVFGPMETDPQTPG